MKHLGQTLAILFFSSFLIFGCGGSAHPSQMILSESQQEILTDTVGMRLQEKARLALEYCKKGKMNTDFCILVDFSLHSGKQRFFVWDFTTDTIIHQSLCAHGYGKGSTKAKPVFSNIEGSYCSSLGKYKIGARAPSQWGIKIHYKLHGLESSNSNAFRRIVVLHSFTPVPDSEIYPTHLPLGWSQGCPVISDSVMRTLDGLLKDEKKSVLLWIFD